MIPGLGTAVNVATVLVGATIGVLLATGCPSGRATSSPTRWAWVTL